MYPIASLSQSSFEIYRPWPRPGRRPMLQCGECAAGSRGFSALRKRSGLKDVCGNLSYFHECLVLEVEQPFRPNACPIARNVAFTFFGSLLAGRRGQHVHEMLLEYIVNF
jgi:hypothetical protein